MKSKVQSPRSATASGQFPKPDLTMFAPHEPPEPRPNLDAPDPGSASSTSLIVTEGEDTAKQKDDSATGTRPRR